jgi:hypothetical protein
MAMDDRLTERYEALFWHYGVGAHAIVIKLKAHIATTMAAQPNFLRTDAAYFLLVNFDHMVFRALAGNVPALNKNEPALLQSMSEGDLDKKALDCLKLILSDLETNSITPVSAHSILLSLNRLWDQIGPMLTWA